MLSLIYSLTFRRTWNFIIQNKYNKYKYLRLTSKYVAFLTSTPPIPLSAIHQNGPESSAVELSTVRRRTPTFDPSRLVFAPSCVFTVFTPDFPESWIDPTDCPGPGKPLVVLVFDFMS